MPDHPRPEPGSDFERFARLVLLLRAAQRDYFRTRSGAALSQCRDLERRVDIAVGWVLSTSESTSMLPGLNETDGDGAYSDRRPVRERKRP